MFLIKNTKHQPYFPSKTDFIEDFDEYVFKTKKKYEKTLSEQSSLVNNILNIRVIQKYKILIISLNTNQKNLKI